MTPFKGRILCTDDDADTRDLIIAILSHHGFEVICADGADTALNLAKLDNFDLYLLDHWMPTMSGIDLTRELRAFDPQTPILFFSGAVREIDQQAAREAGAQAYLSKPASPDALLAEVSRLIGADNHLALESLNGPRKS